jgi:hypothetical protein
MTVYLDDDVTMAFADAIAGNQEADMTASDIDNLSCDGPFCNQTLRLEGTPLPRLNFQWRRRGPIHKKPGKRPVPSLEKDYKAAAWLQGTSCTAIATSLMQQAADYRYGRTSWLGALFAVTGVDAYSTATSRMPSMFTAAATALTTLAGLATAKVNMAILMSYYTQYGCTTQNVHTNVIMIPPAGTFHPNGSTHLACVWVGYEISYNGEEGPWYPISVQECQWQYD